MSPLSTFYMSRVLGNRAYSERGYIGRIRDFIVDMAAIRPKIIGVSIKSGSKTRILDFDYFKIEKIKGQYEVRCTQEQELSALSANTLFLAKNVLDRQLVDIDGRKVVRVNDIRLAELAGGIYTVAVDVGIEGILRRLSMAKPLKMLLKPLGLSIPGKLILWDEVAAFDYTHMDIKLSKEYSKLLTLHPSDLADILEDLDRYAQIAIFASLDEEKAADVLEEMEPNVQVSIIESMTTEKAANVLERMPTDEVADLLDEMQEDKAEELLNEMESETSDEIRELMDYPESEVGSIMSTNFISFNENLTVMETLEELRSLKPESDSIYYLYVLDDKGKLIATVSLRDIVVSNQELSLRQIMKTKVIYIYDDDNINSLAELISKYSLLAIPVVDRELVMLGMVIIDDVVNTLLKSRRKRQ
jgi:magnesium transporter